MEQSSKTTLYMRPKSSKFDETDLPVIQNLLGLGYSEADVGMLLGYQGSNWKISAGKTCEEYQDAIDQGLKLANAYAIKELCKSSFGYDWEEVKTSYKPVEDYDPETGEAVTKMVPVAETRTRKHQPGNARLAELLVTNRLPELFKKFSEIKKTEFSANAELSETQIDGLIGRLLEAVHGVKSVESKTMETSH